AAMLTSPMPALAAGATLDPATTIESSHVVPVDSTKVASDVRSVAERAEAHARALDAAGHTAEAASLRAMISRLTADPVKGPLATVLASGPSTASVDTVKVDTLAPKPGAPEGWRISTRTWTANDNAAIMLDGKFRSDDGHTAALGVDVIAEKGATRNALSLGGHMLTEAGGMRRTDLVELLATHARSLPSGTVVFDVITPRVTLGVQGTGNFGGAGLQDGWHRLGEGTPLEGRHLGEGLQDRYTGDEKYALVLGGGVEVKRELGLLELAADASAKVPIGATGLGWVGTSTTARLGASRGPFAEGSFGARYQWTNGSDLAFSGAPVSGELVYQPRVTLGWQERGWSLTLDWTRNAMGTQPGLGDRDADAIWIGITIGGARR
ncbi:hypothetical protein L6R52_36400, partial [Myxococcota bacterium]|nr:hypothetical protein [Myxococcota bacterium]